MAQPEYIQKLIDVYTAAQQRLIDLIAYKEARGNVIHYQESILRQVNYEIQVLDEYARQWTTETLQEQYMIGVNSAVSGLGRLGVSIQGFEAFSQLHTRVIALLAANTINDLTDANHFVGRTINDAVRKAGLDAIGQKLATGATVKETKKLLSASLIDSGFSGIRTKNGRNINIAFYAELVARSTTREVTNTALMNQLQSSGYDLVQMSSHATTCPVCAVYQGRVYSISGRSTVYPPLNAAFSGQHANIHPNCRHVLLPYISSLADDEQGDIEFSNRSFDVDPRSQAEMDRYNGEQSKKAKVRENKNQYAHMKLALGEDAPRSFSGFMASKRADSDKWRQLQQDMRDFNKAVK